ncbi:uncharacterized protein LOC122055579 isoform X1 [Zingiber officinale]|uniref:Uncharacterized protein n=1 Tax=Zingiber officinale TaxID=94328 RepID=A0A8J5HA42_ZINOF|nr:uncharacterized protein LOC122055579 isoform X1 [Zingiber officinale]KAG6517152.1 hypothetical protein ZIOFF_020532 [Zingiber officinale]
MASTRTPSHRYASVDSRSSSDASPPSFSRKNSGKNLSYLPLLIGNGGGRGTSDTALAAAPRTENYSGALVTAREGKSGRNNFGSLMKKLVEKRTNPKLGSGDRLVLAVPDDLIAKELKKYSKGTHLSALSKKLSQKGGAAEKALTEVKTNTRTLAMVLRSERDLLAQNKDYKVEISELRLLMEEKDREVEKLKDMCLKQGEEIKALKDAILFPDVINSQLQELLEEQDFELKQTKQVIPSLQNQVTYLTGQLQCLAADLAEVKTDKYGVEICSDRHLSNQRTPKFYEAANQLEYSSGDYMASECRSPDDMFLKDLNPCLTPFSKMKSQERDELVYGSPENDRLFRYDTQLS